jgi:hypothetical protein
LTRENSVRRRLASLLALAVATTGLAAAAPAASAAPRATAYKLAEPRDDEGGTKSLTDQLDDASRGYLEAQDALANSKKRRVALDKRLTEIDAELVVRSTAISQIVNQAYRTGRLGPVTAVLNSTSPDGFLERAATLDVVAAKQDRALRDLQASKTSQQNAKVAVDTEVRTQQKQLVNMAKRKAQAENALKAARVGGDDAGGSGASGSSSKATAARRNADGSLPGESCSINDPTTSGCITPRTLHAMQQAKAAGFKRFLSCFRPQGSGEHPKGRACDFAADKGGFGGVATGSSRDYGNRLANYFINNAGRLGVLYVIWFKRIWLPSSGWKSYSRGNGDPSSDHTNHVHLSMR